VDPRERIDSLRVAIQASLDGRQSELWTALPAKVVSFNAAAMTVQAVPTIIMQYNDPLTGTTKPLAIPPINDIPVVFPGGGGFTLTFPVTQGDECLLVFSSRCIDGWWSTGAAAPQGDLRMHDLSDGFAFVGVRSRPKALSGISTSAVQLRSNDGTSHVELSGGRINLVAPSGVYINGIHFDTHEHTGVTSGGSNTGGPV
jgi:hypothetical protein